MSKTNPRSGLTVLVLHAHVIAAMAAIRSLGRAGYRIVAAAPTEAALGFESSFAAHRVVHPPYRDRPRFRAWLDTLIAERGIDAIVPTEELMLTLADDLPAFAHLLPCSTDPALVRRCFSKYLLFEHFLAAPPDSRLSANLPPTRLVGARADYERLPASARTGVIYIKADAALSRNGGTPSRVVRRPAARVDWPEIETWLDRYTGCLLQRHVDGVGIGVFLLLWDGEVRASFMHRRLNEVPHTGGVSSYRRSWWHPDIYDDALRRAGSLGCRGIIMFEYRWDEATDRFHLLEVNYRFWGSMHLALFSGVDFPRLWLDSFFGLPVAPVNRWDRAITCRYTLPLEMRHLASCLGDRRLPRRRKLAKIAEAIRLGLDPRVKSDLWFPGDRRLYWLQMYRYVRDTVRSRITPEPGNGQ